MKIDDLDYKIANVLTALMDYEPDLWEDALARKAIVALAKLANARKEARERV